MKGCEITLDEAEVPLNVSIDVKQIKQVILNMVKNAMDAIEDVGEEHTGLIRISTGTENKYVQISIADNGQGMDHNTLVRLFDPFFTTKESGTGLGLSVSYRIIKNHGGNISVDSKKGEGKIIVGKDQTIELVMTAIIASGHVLLEDVPGTGKTMLAKSVASSLDCTFQRIQFTPDLLPSDLTGIHFFNQKDGDFEFRPGPLFANLVLADEINRATPRTQSSLLECMEERQISIDGSTRQLERPFIVIATQNPVDNQGTFPLPEAQMDRFMMKIRMGYPSSEESVEILRQPVLAHRLVFRNRVRQQEGLAERIIQELLSQIEVPTENLAAGNGR
ncbi:hypothetical protein G195_001943 [Phytophthora kernoviae 00238/432]|uniref:Histidine kinase domain-containing protein n=1 Tax=Phytophthora kernoviae 00238/432 TaxID=1284355 RepID=A0A8J4SHK3_9STRA|nr:hypothetical protein G195_001943 [Phytophthora kernoviae 00238/432]